MIAPDVVAGGVCPEAPLPRALPEERAALADPARPSLFVRQARQAVRAGGPAADRVWAAMPMSVRLVLVMLASSQQGNVERIADQAWGAFTRADRESIGAAARELRAQLSDAGCLA